MKIPNGFPDPDVLASYALELPGRVYIAELRVVGFTPSQGSENNPRWVIFDDEAGRHWTLEGNGSLKDSEEDVRTRFVDHLRRMESEARGWRRWTSRHSRNS